ncbi:F-box family protein [Striga asiatica]|uniref:F-box family protein n=1 Tax=Striga asiatica TaxID=4170 RepID=A0A5A7R5M8_STRAF|nr:F-box family protein [Striga asiatica]
MAALAARFLGITKSKLKSSPSNSYRILPHSPPPIAADPNRFSHRRPMFLVQHSRDKSRNFSVISPDSSWRIDDLRSRVFSSLLSIGNLSLITTFNDLILLSLDRPGYFNMHIGTTSLYGNIFTSYGFGFDPATSRDRCKIVRVFKADCDNYSYPRYRAELYSPETDSWQEIPYPFDYFSNQDGWALPWNSVHANGSYYWLIWERQSALCFDFADEKFLPRLIPLPEKVNSDFRLVEFHGSIAVIVWQGSEVEIWVWNGDGWSWSLASKFDVPTTVGSIECLFKNDKLFLLNIEGELMLFDRATGGLEGLGIHAEYMSIYPYIESTVRLGTRGFLNGKPFLDANWT